MVELQTSELDQVFHALGDGTRRAMLNQLAGGEKTVSQLAEPFDMSLAAASKHIKVLEASGLIRREVRGRTHMCRLESSPLASASAWLQYYEQFWTARLDVLDQLLRAEAAPPLSCFQERQMNMTSLTAVESYGTISEPATLTIQRLLPGPIERVWAYLTDSELRKKWLAAGAMEMAIGSAFEFVWRNDELSKPAGQRPPGFPEEHRMAGTITELDAPRKLAISWGRSGGVTFELEPKGERVLLTLTHRRLPDRDSLLNVSAGWHAHLDVLLAQLEGSELAPFWDRWLALKQQYEPRLPV